MTCIRYSFDILCWLWKRVVKCLRIFHIALQVVVLLCEITLLQTSWMDKYARDPKFPMKFYEYQRSEVLNEWILKITHEMNFLNFNFIGMLFTTALFKFNLFFHKDAYLLVASTQEINVMCWAHEHPKMSIIVAVTFIKIYCDELSLLSK